LWLRPDDEHEVAQLLGWRTGISLADVSRPGAGLLRSADAAAITPVSTWRITPAQVQHLATTWAPRRPHLDAASAAAAAGLGGALAPVPGLVYRAGPAHRTPGRSRHPHRHAGHDNGTTRAAASAGRGRDRGAGRGRGRPERLLAAATGGPGPRRTVHPGPGPGRPGGRAGPGRGLRAPRGRRGLVRRRPGHPHPAGAGAAAQGRTDADASTCSPTPGRTACTGNNHWTAWSPTRGWSPVRRCTGG
jgi:hypothetical protein